MAGDNPTSEPTENDRGRKDKAISQPQPLSEYFGNIRVLGELLRNDAQRPWLTSLPKDVPHHRYVVWLGCNMVRTAHLAETLDDILKSLGTDFVALGGPSHCCGIMHEARSLPAIADNLFRNTLRKVDSFTPEQLLVWCPSCDNQIATRDQSIVSQTGKGRGRVAGFLEQTVPPEKLQPIAMTAAVHWHGDFPEQQEDGESVLSLLARIPGLNLIDMPPADGFGRHCTMDVIGKHGKDTYRQRMLDWDLEARRRGATHTISVYHSCHRQLILLQRGSNAGEFLPVVNYLSILARSLGLAEREDKFARLSGLDVNDMIAEVSSQAKASDIKPDHVRQALVDQFENRS